MIINSIKNDITGQNENAQCLALAAIANVGGTEFAYHVTNDVSKLLCNRDCRPVVKKKAALCLLRLFRRLPESIKPDEWADKLVRLLDDRNTGVQMAALSLLTGICKESYVGYEEAVPRCVRLLTKVVMNRDYAQDYVYANVPCPWLQVKALQLMQLFPPPEDKQTRNRLTDVLTRILGDTHPVKNINRNNTMHAILFEAIRLIIELNFEQELLPQAAGLLGRFVSMKDSNMKYLGLESMTALSKLQNGNSYIQRHQNTITFLLGDADISIRRRALDLAYEMCDQSNVQKLVEQLLEHLTKADFAIREELVLKISILANKYAGNKEYVNYILQLIATAGDFVSDDIWHKVVRVVTDNEDLHEYAVETVMAFVKNPRCHVLGIKVAAVILGEFGSCCYHKDGMHSLLQYGILYSKFAYADAATRNLIFSAICKMSINDPDVKDEVLQISRGLRANFDSDLQQRAVEFCVLAEEMPESTFNAVFEQLPVYDHGEEVDVESPTGAQDDDEEEAEEYENEVDAITFKREEMPDDLLGGLGPTPAPTIQAAVDVSAEMDDLLDMTAAPAKSATNDSVDDLADLLMDAPPVSAPPASSALSTPAVVKAFSLASRSPKGVIYEDEMLQIGWSEVKPYAANLGTVSLHFTNKSPAAFSQFAMTFPDSKELKFRVGQAMDPNIQPGGKGQMGLYAKMEDPFPEPPVATFSFSGPTGPVSFALKLPIVLTKFVTGYACQNGAAFSDLWGKGAAQEVQVTFQTSKQLARPSLEGLLKSLNCSNMPGIDPNAANIVAGCQLESASGKAWCLIRMECLPTMKDFRLTTRGSSKNFAQGTLSIIHTQMLSV